MKKILTTAGVLLGVCLIVLAVSLLATPKTPATAESFEALMTEKGFTVSRADSVVDEYSFVRNVVLAVSPDGSYQLEFYEFADSEYAGNFFASNKELFESAKVGSSSSASTSLKNFEKYTMTNSGRFYAVAVLDNTGIYVTADAEYKDAIKEILKELGY